MHTEGLRRKKLSILKQRKVDVRAQINFYRDKDMPKGGASVETLIEEERELDRQISVIRCARLDLL